MGLKEKTAGTNVSQNRTSYLVGFYSSIIMALTAIISIVLGSMAVPVSGANAPGGGLQYPYLDTQKQFPNDYFWMITAMIVLLAYIVFMVSLHAVANKERRIFGQISLIFTIISAAILLTAYFTQISVVPVSLKNNETAGITLITQYNPHGLFIALEELGYIMMSLSFLFIAHIFERNGRMESFIKWIFIIAFVLTILFLIIVSIQHGIERQDRFEVPALIISWSVLIINGILSSIFFRNKLSIQGINQVNLK